LAEIPHDKPLVSHLARKTFACTVGLANGMNIGVFSKLLEHSSIQITLDSYATVIDELMISNVRALKYKLEKTNNLTTSGRFWLTRQMLWYPEVYII